VFVEPETDMNVFDDIITCAWRTWSFTNIRKYDFDSGRR